MLPPPAFSPLILYDLAGIRVDILKVWAQFKMSLSVLFVVLRIDLSELVNNLVVTREGLGHDESCKQRETIQELQCLVAGIGDVEMERGRRV